MITDGTKGSHDAGLDAGALAGVRQAEQREGAARLGIEDVVFVGQVDGEASATEELVRELVLAIRAFRPAVVLGHDPWRPYELHPDHLVAGRAVCEAVFRAREPRFYDTVPVERPRSPRELWLFNPAIPNHVEDVRAALEDKVDAILRHRSQLEPSFGVRPDDPGARAAVTAVVRSEEAYRRIVLGA